VKEHNFELLEERGGHPRKKRLQVSADTSEHQLAKVRKRDLGRDRGTQQRRGWETGI
jgi:hypothetical protein